MRRILIVAAIAIAVAVFFTSALAADARSTWNDYAAMYSFDTTQSAPMNATFTQSYNGADFENDFARILSAVASAMGTSIPPFGGNDLLESNLQDWPDP